MLKPADPTETKPAAFRRKEQLDRWGGSATDQQSHNRKEAGSKVQFDRGTAFLAACSQCDQSEATDLLRKGVDVDTVNVDGLTALHQACIDDRLPMVQYLVENGASINVRDYEGWTPLHATASCGYMDIASYLVNKGAEIAACNADGDLPIDLAEGGDMENMLAACMNRQNVNANTARKAEERKMLNDANEWIKNPDMGEYEDIRTGATALHVAAVKGYHNVMAALLKAGATVNHQDVDGWTPLHAAAHWGQEESCKSLIDANCNTQLKDKSGLTAVDVADRNMAKLLKELIERKMALDKQNQPFEPQVIRNMAPLKRRSSVTRMSIEDKERLAHSSTLEEKATVLSVKINELDQEMDDVINKEDAQNDESLDVKMETEPEGSVSAVKEEVKTTPEPTPTVEEKPQDSVEEPRAKRADPASWRASLRKTGSSSAVADATEQRPTPVYKSASTTVLGNNITAPTPSSTSLPAQLRPEKSERRPFVSIRDHGISERSSYPMSAGRTQYVPYYRRQQMEREAKAKEEKEAANAAASSAAVSEPSTSAATTTPPMVRSESEPERANPERRISRYETPKRDDEAETNRKIKAKRARETRRSTQGVTQDDVKMAEATLKIAETGRNGSLTSTETEPSPPTPTTTTKPSANVSPESNTSISSATPSTEDSKEKVSEEPTRRRGWGREEGRSSSFRKARDTIISGGSASSVPDALASGSAYARYRNGDVDSTEPRSRYSWRSENKENTKKGKDDEEDADKDASTDNDKKPRLLRSRRNRRERRSTGVINYDENEKNEEEKEQDTSEATKPETNAASADTTGWASRPFTRRYGSTSDVPTQMAGTSNTDRGDRSNYSSRYSRRTPTSAVDGNVEIDYKAQYEQMKSENEQLKKQIAKMADELCKANRKDDNSMGRRERRTLERKVAELEEQIVKMDELTRDNARLKEENGALIRVISKLSK